MSKFVSVAIAVLLAVTGVVGGPTAPRTPTKPLPVAAHKVVAHHWSKTFVPISITGCSTLTSCSLYIQFVTKPTRHFVNGPAIQYRGVSDPDETYALSQFTLPSAIANALTADVTVRSSVSISGAKGHEFDIALCGYSSLSGPGCAMDQPYRGLKSSGIAQTSITLEPGSPQVAWKTAEVTKGSTALLSSITVNITYYALD